ncbi:MAG: hypothetical protein O2782_05810 [bacterium]|nr:hypothetical protein [bacterium]
MNWPETTEDDKDSPPDPGRRGRLLEDIFILLCVLSLWPVILGWNHFLYQALLYAALGGLVFVLVRRARRFSQARREADKG